MTLGKRRNNTLGAASVNEQGELSDLGVVDTKDDEWFEDRIVITDNGYGSGQKKNGWDKVRGFLDNLVGLGKEVKEGYYTITTGPGGGNAPSGSNGGGGQHTTGNQRAGINRQKMVRYGLYGTAIVASGYVIFQLINQ